MRDAAAEDGRCVPRLCISFLLPQVGLHLPQEGFAELVQLRVFRLDVADLHLCVLIVLVLLVGHGQVIRAVELLGR